MGMSASTFIRRNSPFIVVLVRTCIVRLDYWTTMRHSETRSCNIRSLLPIVVRMMPPAATTTTHTHTHTHTPTTHTTHGVVTSGH